MYITIVGGGNSSPIMACLAKMAGHKVAVFTRRPGDWSKTVGFDNDDLVWLPDAHREETIDLLTSDPKECIPQSDMIFIAGLPIHHNPALLQQMKPHINPNKKVFIGSICAYGGFNWVVRRELGPEFQKVAVFGTQLIPWCCGTKVYGKTGWVIGAKRFLRIATEDGVDSIGVKAVLTPILKQELRDSDFLASALWPNNPSLHPPILYGIFKDWDGVSPLDPETLPVNIYKDLRTGSAHALSDLDGELVAITAGLAKVFPDNKALQSNFSLKACIIENYEDQVTCKYNNVTCVMTNKAFAAHKIPYEKIEGGVVPILKHKFFETDLPFGLATWKDMALMMDLKTPMLDALILWNQRLVNLEFMTPDGLLNGKDCDQAIIPSRMGLTLKTLTGIPKFDDAPASKKRKH